MIARYWPVLVVLYAGMSYGFVFPINRFVTEAGVPFLGYVFWQAAGAAAILLSDYRTISYTSFLCLPATIPPSSIIPPSGRASGSWTT